MELWRGPGKRCGGRNQLERYGGAGSRKDVWTLELHSEGNGKYQSVSSKQIGLLDLLDFPSYNKKLS